MGGGLTLEAAIRDAAAPRPAAREQALVQLPAALLAAIGRPGPLWRAWEQHPRGPAAHQALRRALHDDPEPVMRGHAAVALGRLGDPDVVAPVRPWCEEPAPDPFLRESAVLALGYLGVAAREHADTRGAVRALLRQALAADEADLRFQAGVALVQVDGARAEAEVVRALRGEAHPEVRGQLAHALTLLNPPGELACAALGELLARADGTPDETFVAATGLAAARRTEGAARLVLGLSRPEERDEACEALAVLAPSLPSEPATAARARARRLAASFWTPQVTRVRAAYLLARLGAPEGPRLLDRLARSRRPAVREAVEDARAALRALS